MRRSRPSAPAAATLGPALRVAAVATLTVAVLYVVLVTFFVTLMSQRLTRQTDLRVADELAKFRHELPALQPVTPRLGDADDAPVYVWVVSSSGAVTTASTAAPVLPRSVATATQHFPRTVHLGNSEFRIAVADLPDGSRLFAAESLAQEQRVRGLLVVTALLVSPVLVGGVFVSAFTIGRQASKPIEQARRRQLEFTADASHELRTPLTVIDAEVGLALSSERSAPAYRDSLRRVSGETQRLRRIVEDLLWLARFDSEPPAPPAELVDVPTVVRQSALRFAPIVETRGIDLDIEVDEQIDALIAAPPEWIDRLVGVLLDNALRYAKPNGRVEVAVAASSAHVVLSVSDDGPGVPVSERARLFDRFHRVADDQAVAGPHRRRLGPGNRRCGRAFDARSLERRGFYARRSAHGRHLAPTSQRSRWTPRAGAR